MTTEPTITINRKTLGIEVNGKPISLGRREGQLLRILIEEPSRVFSKRELIESMQRDKSWLSAQGLDSIAATLRNELACAGADGYVANCWGVGYRLGAS